VAISLLSNHYHMIVRAESAKRLSRFVGYFNSNLAREVSRLTDWTRKIWDRRYQAILISNEEVVQVARFRYVLSQGVKENVSVR
jgi:REP element-mobilizing transposase RayT